MLLKVSLLVEECEREIWNLKIAINIKVKILMWFSEKKPNIHYKTKTIASHEEEIDPKEC